MTTTNTARQYTCHDDLARAGKFGDFVQLDAEAGIFTDRISAIRTVDGAREITLDMVMTDHHKGVYRTRIERMTETRPAAGGRRVALGGVLLAEQTGPEPLDPARLRQLHTELLAR